MQQIYNLSATKIILHWDRLALQHAIMELEQVQDEMQQNQDNVEGKCVTDTYV